MRANILRYLMVFVALCGLCSSCSKPTIDVMLITGHTDRHHSWEVMSECIVDILAEHPPFNVDIVMVPESGVCDEDFAPNFESYDVVIFNINDVAWSDVTKQSFERYIEQGGGMVVVHEANNSFPEWIEFNRMIALGGWGGRTEKDGPYYYWRDGEFVTDTTPGKGGSHGRRVPFDVTVRNSDHPIMRGLPQTWTQIDDELYSNLRGPAENIEVLATAYSQKESGGSGKEEPILFTITYGKGRIFHTVLGHTRKDFTTAVRTNRGFQVTLSRGVEWAATGRVKQDISF
ncbi:MAG: ThuA domain-containing protein [Rikenellaceae bacterium]